VQYTGARGGGKGSQGGRKNRVVACTKTFVIIEIGTVLGLFCYVMVMKIENKDADEEVLRRMRIA
jgi:hypothetical protein